MIGRSLFSRIFKKYNYCLENYPISTQAWTSGILALVGDVFTQRLEDKIREKKALEELQRQQLTSPLPPPPATPSPIIPTGAPSPSPIPPTVLVSESPARSLFVDLDIRRNLSVTTFGLWYGWWGHYWYKWLDVFAHRQAKQGSFKFVMTKVLSEQIFWNPATLVLYFASVSIMEGKGTAYIKQKLTEDFGPTLAIELLTWPALTGVIFKYSPVRYQLVWINVLELFYDAFLSWIQHNGYHLPGAKQHH